MKLQPLLLIVAITASVAALAAPDKARYFVRDRSIEGSPLPFSEAVLTGNTLYVAGHIGIDPKTDRAPQDAGLEAKLVMDAVKSTIESAGLTLDNLTTVTVYCTDLGLYDTFNAVYKTYFQVNFPARAFVGVSQLLRGAHFEVQGIAVKPGKPRT